MCDVVVLDPQRHSQALCSTLHPLPLFQHHSLPDNAADVHLSEALWPLAPAPAL